MDNCIFCKIVKGELPSYKVYEDEEFLAFLDISPRTKGHTLVIPKAHYRWAYDMPEELFGKAWKVVHKITKKIQLVLKPNFITYLTFGTEVPHAHLWIIPRYDLHSRKQGEEVVPSIKKMSPEELIKIASLLFVELRSPHPSS